MCKIYCDHFTKILRKQNKIFIEFELRWKNRSWIGPFVIIDDMEHLLPWEEEPVNNKQERQGRKKCPMVATFFDSSAAIGRKAWDGVRSL